MADAYARIARLQKRTPTERRRWQTGLWQRLPWTGLLALMVGLGCGITALSIAMVSDGKPLDFWRVGGYDVQPTVLLSILTTLANIVLGYAFSCGLTVSWWLSALRGRTLRHLHTSQSQATSLVALFSRRPAFNVVTVASILLAALLMDQPLFQRGIRVVTRQGNESTMVTLPVSSSPLQKGATGIIADHKDDLQPTLYHPLFSNVSRQYDRRDAIRIPGFTCVGSCTTEIVTAGWDVACNESSTPYRLMSTEEFINWRDSDVSDENSTTVAYSGPARTQTMFDVSAIYNTSDAFIDYSAANYQIKISAMHKATPGGNGTMKRRDCILSEALIRYPVHINGDVLTLQPMPWSTNTTVQILARGYESSGMSNSPSTLGGIWMALNSKYRVQANISHVAGWNSIDTWDGDIVSSTYLRAEAVDDLQSDNVTWADPIDDIIAMAHELTLRAAIATTHVMPYNAEGNLITGSQPEVMYPNLTLVNRTLEQQATMTRSYTETVYQTQVGWVAGAFILIMLACLSIVPTYWGWWNLGRPVTMSPLEIAKAFDAPLLRPTDPNGTAADHIRIVGDMRLRYGPDDTTLEPSKRSDVELQSLHSNDPTSTKLSAYTAVSSAHTLRSANSASLSRETVATQEPQPYDYLSPAFGNTFDVRDSASAGANGPRPSHWSSDSATAVSPLSPADRHHTDWQVAETELAGAESGLKFRMVGNVL